MIRAVFALVAVLLVPSLTHAQTIGRVDLSAFGFGLGVVGLPQAIETDGNPSTQEWLLSQVFSNQRRVVSVQPDGTVCAGPIFHADGSWYVQRVGHVSMLTRLAWPIFEWMALPHPTC